MLLLTLAFLLALADQSPLQQGLLSMQKGEYSEAKLELEKATQENPRDAIAWASLAETCRRLKETEEASEAAKHAADTGSDNPMVAHALAVFYSAEGSFAEAAKWEEKYAGSAKADPEALPRASEFYARGGDTASAERTLKAAWQTRRADPQISFALAKLLLQKLDFSGAADAIAMARKLHPKDPQLVLVSGVANYGERRFPEAVNDFLNVISIDPAIPQPYQFLGKMLEHAGMRLPELTGAFERRVRQSPQDPTPYVVLAKAKLAANSRDASAEALLRRSIEIDDKQWEAHYELGVILEGKREFKTAAEELGRAASLNPKQAMPHYHLARVYDRLGDSDHARSERKLHEELTPQN